MKILFIAPSYKPAYTYGGTIVVIAMLAEQLARLGADVSVFTTMADGASELDVISGYEYLIDGVKVTYFKRITGDHTHASPRLWLHLFREIKKYDVVHLHSWWNFLILGAAMVCKIKGIRPVFSPHGMLSTYIIETNNRRKKAIMNGLLGKNLLKGSVLHVTAESELSESRKIIPSWKGQVIPNLVKLSEVFYPRKDNEIFTIGFLGRIDPKKGLDVLLKALSKVSFDYKLQIAGEGRPMYVDELKNLIKELGISSKVEWVGWKGEDTKFEFLSQLDLFVLTSHNENFAIVVIEALSVGTPVLISEEVGLAGYVKERELGWVTTLDIQRVVYDLYTLHSNVLKRKEICLQASRKIGEDFDETVLAKRYMRLYESTL
ncbi:MAG: glycosyltransferase [Pedobacter sp.]|nr:MAG: glycosyltransferase [Pedobacter sp.]